MRVVVKGAFIRLERKVRWDVLQRYDALVVRGRLRGRPWWKPHNQRWTGSPRRLTRYVLVAGLALIVGVVVESLALFR